MSPERTWSSSAAALRTSPPGWRVGARGRSASTSRRRSSRPRGRCSASSGSSFRSSRRMRRERAAGRRLVRSRRLRVRRLDLVRSLPWIPEAARLLRPGGELLFLRNSTLSMLCAPSTAGTRPLQTAAARAAPPRLGDENTTEFHLGHGDLFQLLRESGFDVLDLVELYAPADGEGRRVLPLGPPSGRKKWPWEEIWKARKR